MFGRPPRDTGLESERNNRLTAAQALHLLNSNHLRNKLRQGSGITDLLNEADDAYAAAELLYLTILSRRPTDDERGATVGLCESPYGAREVFAQRRTVSRLEGSMRPRAVWKMVRPVLASAESSPFEFRRTVQGFRFTLDAMLTETSRRPGFKPTSPFVRGQAPTLIIDLTDYGYHYAVIRPLGADEVHIRTYHFIMPFHQIRPSRTEQGTPAGAGHIWVPMDDETTMVYNWHVSVSDEPLADDDRLERRSGNGPYDVDQTTFRSIRNRQNNYLLDRQAQRTETFTGIDGINTQDRGIQESMGPVVDRSREHLGPADRAVIQAMVSLR